MELKKNPFPSPYRLKNDEDIVFVGGKLDPATLKAAYYQGIFPWPMDGFPLLWHCPNPRGVLDFSESHIPRSLKKLKKKNPYQITVNQAFQQVIVACAKVPRSEQLGTWITAELLAAYIEFHKLGYAHSIECWLNNNLVGGLYGVYVKGTFSGESMFYLESNASKLCLLYLIDLLKDQGLTWMDIQMVTPITKQLGGKYIPRREFLARLEHEHAKNHPEKLIF